MKRPVVYALTGPTAVGKTALSLGLAERLGAEIVSCDSRQVFRALTIGTAKPSEAVLRQIRHHFVNERDLNQPWSAGAFAQEAESRIRAIHADGRAALVVGGSTLYLHALAHGLARLPAPDLELREALNQVAMSEEGRLKLYQELERVDPVAAKTLDPSKSQRLVRFVEVYRSSGRPVSSFWQDHPPPRFDVRVAVLDRPREELYARIHTRVDEMLDKGLLAEVRELKREGWTRDGTPVLRTIGYQEPLRFLESEWTLNEMLEHLKRNTRRYAKRQLTWFRRQPCYTWYPADSPVERLISGFENP